MIQITHEIMKIILELSSPKTEISNLFLFQVVESIKRENTLLEKQIRNFRLNEANYKMRVNSKMML